MKHLALTQPALNALAKVPGGPKEMADMRAKAIKIRDDLVRDHDKSLTQLDGLIHRIGIALGELST